MELSFCKKSLISIPLMLVAFMCMVAASAVYGNALWLSILNCISAAGVTVAVHILMGHRGTLSVYAICVAMMAMLAGPELLAASQKTIVEYAGNDMEKLMPITAAIMTALLLSMLIFMLLGKFLNFGIRLKKISFCLEFSVAVMGSISLILFSFTEVLYAAAGIVMSICLSVLWKYFCQSHHTRE